MLGNLFNAFFASRDAAQLARLAQARQDTWDAWLQPLPGENGVGRDPGYEDAFFTLKDEAGKLSDIDDALIAQSCEQLLKETGKDLRLAGYYTFARLRQDGPAGFADGLELTAALLERFGDALLPGRAEAKKGALEMLTTTRVSGLLDAHGDFAPADLARALAALDVLLGAVAAWPEAARPNLQALVMRFGSQHKPDEPVQAVPTASAGQGDAGSAPPAAGVQAMASTRDLLDQARTMAAWLRGQENGYLCATRLVRCVRWDTLHDIPPADAASCTRLPAPRAQLRQQMQRLALQKQWPELLERVESAFMEGANHLWFDLQYFQHQALDCAGAPYTAWRDILRTDFALFLERLPGIERLTFDDGTPFANDTTLEWIARYAVVRDLKAGENMAPLPVSISAESGELAASDWPEIGRQAREVAACEGVQAAFAWLDALPGLHTERHRYLQRLVMARLADHAGHADLALVLFDELDALARTLTVVHWEPALVFEVRQQLMQVLKAARARRGADKPALAKRIGELQAELAVLNPARALGLAS